MKRTPFRRGRFDVMRLEDLLHILGGFAEIGTPKTRREVIAELYPTPKPVAQIAEMVGGTVNSIRVLASVMHVRRPPRGYSRRAACAIAAIVACSTARAAPPEHADPAMAGWFQSLQRPDGLGGCCSQSDCRAVEYRQILDHYEALVTPEAFPATAKEPMWVGIPAKVVLKKTDNPTGRAILCWTPGTGPLCFVTPPEG